MTTQINNRLEAAGINPTGIYANMANIIEDAILTVREFGYEKWENQTSAGKTVKEIVKELS